MRILQIGAHYGNDHVQEYAKNNRPDHIVLVEPNPKCHDQLVDNYQDFNTTVLHTAVVVNGVAEITLYIPSSDELSQHTSSDARHLNRHGHTDLYEIKVSAIHINDLLDLFVEVDRLYIDTEGLDIAIINSIDLEKYKIPYIMFEYIHSDGPLSWGGPKLEECVSRLHQNGYKTHKDGYNVIAELQNGCK